MHSNLSLAPRASFNSDFHEAARIVCKNAEHETPEAFALAYRVYSEAFAQTLLHPQSAAYDAALKAVRASNPTRIVLLYCVNRDGEQITRPQRLPADKAERLQIARNRAEMSAPIRSTFRPLSHCDTGNRWVTEETP